MFDIVHHERQDTDGSRGEGTMYSYDRVSYPNKTGRKSRQENGENESTGNKMR